MNNANSLRGAYKAWADTRGESSSAWLALVADDFHLRSLADGAPGMEFSAERNGREELLGYFEGLKSSWEMLHFSADEFIEEGDRIVVVGTCGWKNKSTRKTVHSTYAHIWRFRGDKAVEFFEFYDTAKAIAATLSD